MLCFLCCFWGLLSVDPVYFFLFCSFYILAVLTPRQEGSGVTCRWINRQVARRGDALAKAPQPHFHPLPPIPPHFFI